MQWSFVTWQAAHFVKILLVCVMVFDWNSNVMTTTKPNKWPIRISFMLSVIFSSTIIIESMWKLFSLFTLNNCDRRHHHFVSLLCVSMLCSFFFPPLVHVSVFSTFSCEIAKNTRTLQQNYNFSTYLHTDKSSEATLNKSVGNFPKSILKGTK